MKHYIFLLTLLVSVFQINAETVNKRLLKGKVIDEKGNPVSGATITTSYSDERGATGSNGEFSMQIPSKGLFTFLVSDMRSKRYALMAGVH